jgi:hypothetical protein
MDKLCYLRLSHAHYLTFPYNLLKPSKFLAPTHNIRFSSQYTKTFGEKSKFNINFTLKFSLPSLMETSFRTKKKIFRKFNLYMFHFKVRWQTNEPSASFCLSHEWCSSSLWHEQPSVWTGRQARRGVEKCQLRHITWTMSGVDRNFTLMKPHTIYLCCLPIPPYACVSPSHFTLSRLL